MDHRVAVAHKDLQDHLDVEVTLLCMAVTDDAGEGSTDRSVLQDQRGSMYPDKCY